MSSQSDQLVRNLFKKELADLLSKYGAFIEADDHYQGYPECGQDIRIIASIGDVDIDLGQYIFPEKLKENIDEC